MITNTINWSVSSDSGSSPVTGSQGETGGTEIVINQQFAGAGSNVAYAVAFPMATIQSIILVSNKNMTILVNSTTAPILTINLVAGAPYVWDRSTGYFANPFTADVTTFYVSNTPAATLKGKVLKA